MNKKETYIDRMEQELKDLQKKTLALNSFLYKNTKIKLSYNQIDLLVIQLNIMKSYISILSTRIKNEKRK